MIKTIVSLGLAALLAVPGILVSSDGVAQRDPLVTLSFQQARLPTVVGALARQTGLSFIIAPDVGSIVGVDVELRAVRFSTALEALARQHEFCVAQPTPDIVSLKSCIPAPQERSFQFGGVTFLLPVIQGT